jgi:hypothetical protein
MKYTGEIEGQYGSQEDPKKLALIREFPGNTGELVTLTMGTGVLPPGLKGSRGIKLTTHPI